MPVFKEDISLLMLNRLNRVKLLKKDWFDIDSLNFLHIFIMTSLDFIYLFILINLETSSYNVH